MAASKSAAAQLGGTWPPLQASMCAAGVETATSPQAHAESASDKACRPGGRPSIAAAAAAARRGEA
eukprot:scaffold170769_cov28-Tisochrysis_lutea.AAC.5